MPRKRPKYVWPASALTDADMALLYSTRESSIPRIPISALIAAAVKIQYGKTVQFTPQPTIATQKAA